MSVAKMSLKDVFAQLESWINEKRVEINARKGIVRNQFGLGKVR
ncbi:hypothetical protein [Peribacillus sp. NPDC096540]